jgi:hypothetical protein
MPRNTFSNLADSFANTGGQNNNQNSQNNRIIYSAIVRDNNDYAGLNRLKCEIVSQDENGVIIPGKDKDTPLNKLPICVPLLPEHIHVRPQIGEAVLIICENPQDLTSTRFWIGPLISQQTKLAYQSYTDASEIFKINTYSQKNTTSNPTTNNLNKAAVYFPQPSDVALQGKQDSDIIFTPRKVVISAGRFKKGTTELNTTTPSFFEIKQVDSEQKTDSIKIFDRLSSAGGFKPYSQANLKSTNINIFSPEGKFKKAAGVSDVEISTRLKDFGEIANSLHPTVFGDELIILLKLIIRFLITHIHTPQSPAIPNDLTPQLMQYLEGPKLQELLSNVVRIN